MIPQEPDRPGCPCRACGRSQLRLVGITPDGIWCQCPACRRIWRCEKCPQFAPQHRDTAPAHKRQS